MEFIKKFLAVWKFLKVSKPADWKDTPADAKTTAEAQATELGYEDPDKIYDDIDKLTPSPVYQFNENLKENKVKVSEAYVFKGLALERKKINESQYGFRLNKNPKNNLTETKKYFIEKMDGAKYKKLVEDCFSTGSDTSDTIYDPNQYTEYTPFMPGPFFKQMYLYDRQLMNARVFEMFNHNAIARTAVLLRRDYVVGRNVGVRETKEGSGAKDLWDKFDKEFKIQKRLHDYWFIKLMNFGNLFIDTINFRSYDEGTIWEIITEPENIENVYYYYQSFPTQYQMFAGMDVKGVAGSKDTKISEYIIRQIPYDRIIHTKVFCDESEKYGRSLLYPNLGNLKRFQDTLKARSISEWLKAMVVFDDEVDGSPSDITTHLAKFGKIPKGNYVFAHTPKIKRTLLQATGMSGADKDSFLAELIYIVATGAQLPKEFFNISATGNTRASAILAGEPFQKAIESDQLVVEELLHKLADAYWRLNGLEYNRDLEFIFPSVVKDTTTETLKNIYLAEMQGWVSKPTAASMSASELNITNFDFEKEKKQMADDKEKSLNDAMGFGGLPTNYAFNAKPFSNDKEKSGSEVYGQQKQDLKKQLKSL